MGQFLSLFLFFLSVSFLSPFGLFSDEIITTKEDEPDAYYGLKLNSVITPTFGYRLRDSSSGVSNSMPNDRTGFSLPWSLIMISKEWEEKGIKMEVWGELARNSSLSADTKVNGGVKNNPYIFQFRRANIQKKWENGDFSTTIIFGIQELPHVYSQWKNYWDWRYIDRAPMESLGFAPAPADLGLSTTFQYSIFQFYLGVMNGEGYRQIQNTESGGFDVYSRLSIEKEWEKGKLGIHFISRLGNLLGAIGNECREGKTDCLASDSNISTSKEKDLRSIKTETFGIELNAGFLKIINYGVGAISRRKFGGLTYDRLNLSSLPEYEKDLTGRAGYVWLSYMYKQFTVGYKYESGTGNNGVLNVFNSRSDGYYYYLDSNSYYRSKEKFKRILGFIEYNYDETLRFAIGYAEVQNFDKNRYPKKIYIDTVTGEESNEAGYLSQWNNSSSLPKIVSYNDRKDRQLFFKTMISF